MHYHPSEWVFIASAVVARELSKCLAGCAVPAGRAFLDSILCGRGSQFCTLRIRPQVVLARRLGLVSACPLPLAVATMRVNKLVQPLSCRCVASMSAAPSPSCVFGCFSMLRFLALHLEPRVRGPLCQNKCGPYRAIRSCKTRTVLFLQHCGSPVRSRPCHHVLIVSC